VSGSLKNALDWLDRGHPVREQAPSLALIGLERRAEYARVALLETLLHDGCGDRGTNVR
jgi:NAD(P)H-dependent FMN reductase